MNADDQGLGQVLLYQTDTGDLRLECRLEGESLWLSLNQMAELSGRDKSVISKHLKAIYEDGELIREATVAKHATVQIGSLCSSDAKIRPRTYNKPSGFLQLEMSEVQVCYI